MNSLFHLGVEYTVKHYMRYSERTERKFSCFSLNSHVFDAQLVVNAIA